MTVCTASWSKSGCISEGNENMTVLHIGALTLNRGYHSAHSAGKLYADQLLRYTAVKYWTGDKRLSTLTFESSTRELSTSFPWIFMTVILSLSELWGKNQSNDIEGTNFEVKINTMLTDQDHFYLHNGNVYCLAYTSTLRSSNCKNKLHNNLNMIKIHLIYNTDDVCIP